MLAQGTQPPWCEEAQIVSTFQPGEWRYLKKVDGPALISQPSLCHLEQRWAVSTEPCPDYGFMGRVSVVWSHQVWHSLLHCYRQWIQSFSSFQYFPSMRLRPGAMGLSPGPTWRTDLAPPTWELHFLFLKLSLFLGSPWVLLKDWPMGAPGPLKLTESESCSVVSDSLWPHGLHSLWNSPDQNTGVGSLSLLQGIFPTQGSNPGLLHCRWILYQLSYHGTGHP